MAPYALTLTLAVCLAACGGSVPTQPSVPAPSPSPPPPPTSSGVTLWNITQRFVSVEGPDNCWIRFQRERLTGLAFPGLDTAITRLDGSIRVDSPWFQVNYAGTYSDRDFTATGVAPLDGGGRLCDGISYQQLPGTSNLTGRFAVDDLSMTATEVNSYRLTTGEAVTYSWAWTATRLN